MCHMTKYCNMIGPHCTVRRDTACIYSSPDPSLLLQKWVGLTRLPRFCSPLVWTSIVLQATPNKPRPHVECVNEVTRKIFNHLLAPEKTTFSTCLPFERSQVQLIMGVSNWCTAIWNGTMEWKMEWNGECTQLQLTRVTDTAQSRLSHLVYL